MLQISHQSHDHDPHDEIPFDEKLTKLLSHWIKHNEDHALNYRNWAEKAKTNGNGQAAGLLEEAAEMSLAINEGDFLGPAEPLEGQFRLSRGASIEHGPGFDQSNRSSSPSVAGALWTTIVFVETAL